MILHYLIFINTVIYKAACFGCDDTIYTYKLYDETGYSVQYMHMQSL